jgi:hypothetical protein
MRPAASPAIDAGAGAGGQVQQAGPQPNPLQPGTPDPGHLQRGAAPARAPEEGRGDPRNRSEFERYKDELRAQMEQPHAEDPRLKSHLNTLYRPNAKIGSGSTAAAVRHEEETGGQVGGKNHSQKASDSVLHLQRWLAGNQQARPGDRAAAENVLRDQQNALGNR